MKSKVVLVTGLDDDHHNTILGIYPSSIAALERMEYLAKVGKWRGIDSHELEISDYGTDLEITLTFV
jgi:hypothetical protein